uniref:outer membrane beta-barrel protein n=1 Tax=Nitritalea halalkaliphila TaxID=590849 RepID=UPI0029348A36|nr:outer membrane beta-barrel protein [Nitritalea halalkaliphila]
MKKLMVVALLLMGFAAQAQEFSIGPKVGVNQGNIRVNGAGFESGDAQLGYHVGAFIRLGGNSLFVQPEVLFTNTGGEILADVNGDQFRLTLVLIV